MSKKKIALGDSKIAIEDSPLLHQPIQIRDLRLLSSSCAIRIPGDESQRLSQELTQTIEVKGGKKDSPKSIVFEITFSLVAGSSDEQDGLRIKAVFGIIYSVEHFEDVSGEDISTFGQLFGVSHSWPYWREFVQSMVARMGLPPLVLPLMRPTSPVAQTQKTQKKKAKKNS